MCILRALKTLIDYMKISRQQLRGIIKECMEINEGTYPLARRYSLDSGAPRRLMYSPFPYTGFNDVQQVSPEQALEGFDLKPRGLWYGCGTEWAESLHIFDVHGRYEDLADEYTHLYEVQLNEENILFIKTTEDFDRFEAMYAVDLPGHRAKIIDWRKVAQKYAGIEICPYRAEKAWQQAHPLSRPDSEISWYDDWDVASGCIWSSSGIADVVEIPMTFFGFDKG